MRARAGAVLLTFGAVLMIIGSVAPWVTSVGISSNSWDLRSLVLELGFSDNGVFEVAVTLWAIVPVSLVAAAAVAWWGKALPSAILGLIGALYGGVVAFAVLLAPDIGLFDVEWGVPMTFVAAVVVLVAVVWQVGLTITGRSNAATGSE